VKLKTADVIQKITCFSILLLYQLSVDLLLFSLLEDFVDKKLKQFLHENLFLHKNSTDLGFEINCLLLYSVVLS